MASHGTSPSSQSPAMLPAGRHEPFVQRKARRRPYRRCPWGSFDVWWCLATPEFSVFFLGGGSTTTCARDFLMIQEKEVKGIYGGIQAFPFLFAFFLA